MIYSYRCSACGATAEAIRKVKDRRRAPKHSCAKGGKMSLEITGTHHVAPLFTPYRAVGEERGRRIRSRQEHHNYLKRHGYEEVGNDASYAPPPDNPDLDRAKARATAEALRQLEYAPSLE